LRPAADALIVRDAQYTCPECFGHMVLTRIESSRIGFELRRFQGVNCDHVDKVIKICSRSEPDEQSGLPSFETIE
jgi:hypothetical protein